MATYTTYDAVGIREDLSDTITNISPVDTQFYSAIGAGKAAQTKVEWIIDALDAAADNAQVEGADRTAGTITPGTRVYNMCQIQAKTFQISDTNDTVKAAGSLTSVGYQTAKNMKSLATDIEKAFLNGVRADGTSSVARTMRGALNWCTTNLSKATDATLNADGTITAGTARALTETILVDNLQDIFSAGGDPDTIFAPPVLKRAISGFSQATNNYRIAVEGGKLDSVVDVYVSDFGQVTIKAHRLMDTDKLFICDTKLWKKATLRPTGKRQLAKTGDSQIFDLTVEHTLMALQEAGNGRITDLS